MEQVIAARITGFVATMRANGFAVGIRETEDALRVAASIDVLQREPLRWGWRGLLCSSADDWHRFDILFDSFWLPPNSQRLVESHASGAGKIELDPVEGETKGQTTPSIQKVTEDDVAKAGPAASKEGASPVVALETANFRSLTDPEQMRAIEILIRRFARRLQRVRTRRDRAEVAGRRLDLRRTIRRSIGTGGSPSRLSFLAPRRVRPRLVLLLDVSRSMSLYSFFYLRVARALTKALPDIHVFLYHTHLTSVSAALSDSDPWRAQERLQLLSAGWAGGTRIGECLAAFNQQYVGRLVHARTAVIIASDGYDTGEAGFLGREMALLAQRARRIVWLNPLKANPGYAPLARGMREALPYVDLFAPGHDLASLDIALTRLMEVLA